MGNRWPAAAGLTAVAFLAAACGANSSHGSSGAGSAYGSPSSQAGSASAGAVTAALKTTHISLGTIVTSSSGYALYYFTEDKPGRGTSACSGSCASTWPPLTGTVQAPAGVTLPGPLGTITRPGGAKQVTINGYPVYTYAGDKSPGQASGNGAEGEWHVIKIGSSAAAQARVLKLMHTSAGTVLAGPHGFTLYYFTEDKPGRGTSACSGSCAALWPPLAAPVQAPAGATLPGPLGTITRPGGAKQVTINGYPVYTYAGDKAPGQASGNGAEGEWHVIKISGSSSGSSGTGGGGYGY
jgi:predicted lipoprotein with Yx(FWY)xxD motif